MNSTPACSGALDARPVIALVTSNGTGMGHLARQASVALALGDAAKPVVFSLSRALPAIRYHGLSGEYCPSREQGWMPLVHWQGYLRERLRAFVRETGASAVVFDGVVPYLGLLRARMDLPDVAFVWMRRGFWRSGAPASPLRSSPLFDAVLEPGDLAGEGDHGATSGCTDAVRLPPVSLVEHIAPLDRQQAAEALGLDPQRPTALITLSSGVLNDVATPGAAAVATLLDDPAWQVAVTSSALHGGGIGIADPDRCVELTGVYPLARYLTAFDAAVAAGGYNAVHELLYAKLPTLFVPNRSSGTDDQPARTRRLADAGLALYADESRVDEVRSAAAQLRDPELRDRLRSACAELPAPVGSAAAARHVLELARGRGAGGRRYSRLRAAEVVARLGAMRALGQRATMMLRRLARRSGAAHPAAPARRLSVRLTEDGGVHRQEHSATGPDRPVHDEPTAELVLSECVEPGSPAQQERNRMVEHLLPGTSAHYRSVRLAIARRYFDTS